MAILVAFLLVVASVGLAAERAEVEARLLGVLEGDAAVEAKIAACEQLRAAASERAVPVLVKLSGHEAKGLRDAAVRTLANSGQLAAAGPLLTLATGSDDPLHRGLALRGYLQLARTGTLELEERSRMLERIAPAAKNATELRLLLSAAGDVPDAASLKLVAAQLDGEVKQEAAIAAVKLAEALWRSDGVLVRETMLRTIPLLPEGDLRRQADALAQRASNLAALLKPAAEELQAAIDADAETYWSGEPGRSEYRLAFAFDRPRNISAIGLTGFAHHDRAPRDLQIVADGRVIKNLKNAIYEENLLWEETPGLRVQAIEIRITRWHGAFPVIREMSIAEATSGP